jgi:hypothetical protein
MLNEDEWGRKIAKYFRKQENARIKTWSISGIPVSDWFIESEQQKRRKQEN